MNTQRVAGWFMIGVFLPIACVFTLVVSHDVAAPAESVPYFATVAVTISGAFWLLKRMSFHHRPPRPHALFTPYYDQR